MSTHQRAKSENKRIIRTTAAIGNATNVQRLGNECDASAFNLVFVWKICIPQINANIQCHVFECNHGDIDEVDCIMSACIDTLIASILH